MAALARRVREGDSWLVRIAWSPEGDIYVMNADGSGVTRLTNSSGHDSSPAWSPFLTER